MDAVTETRYSAMRANLQTINTSSGINDGELLSLGHNTCATQNELAPQLTRKTQ